MTDSNQKLKPAEVGVSGLISSKSLSGLRRLFYALIALLAVFILLTLLPLVTGSQTRVVSVQAAPVAAVQVGEPVDCTVRLSSPWYMKPAAASFFELPEGYHPAAIKRLAFDGCGLGVFYWKLSAHTYAVEVPQKAPDGEKVCRTGRFVLHPNGQEKAGTAMEFQLPAVNARDIAELETLASVDKWPTVAVSGRSRWFLFFPAVTVLLIWQFFYLKRLRRPINASDFDVFQATFSEALENEVKFITSIQSLVDCFRKVLDSAFQLDSAGMSTAELLAAIEATAELKDSDKALFRQFIQAADRIRFSAPAGTPGVDQQQLADMARAVLLAFEKLQASQVKKRAAA